MSDETECEYPLLEIEYTQQRLDFFIAQVAEMNMVNEEDRPARECDARELFANMARHVPFEFLRSAMEQVKMHPDNDGVISDDIWHLYTYIDGIVPAMLLLHGLRAQLKDGREDIWGDKLDGSDKTVFDRITETLKDTGKAVVDTVTAPGREAAKSIGDVSTAVKWAAGAVIAVGIVVLVRKAS